MLESTRLTDRLITSLVERFWFALHGAGEFEVKKRLKEQKELWACSSSGGTCMTAMLAV